VHYLIAPGTVDDVIWPLVAHKVEVVSAMCDGQKDKLVVNVETKDKAKQTAVGDKLAARIKGGISPGGGMDEATEHAELHTEDFATAFGTGLLGPPKEDKKDNDESKEGEENKEEKKGKKRGRKKKEQAPSPPEGASVVDMLQGKAKPGRPSKSKKLRCTSEGHIDVDAMDSDLSNSEAEEEAAEQGPPPHSKWAFCISGIAGRVHLLHADGIAVGCNFKLVDWYGMQESGTFPSMLLENEELRAATIAFMKEWAGLTPTQQRQLIGDKVKMQLPLSQHVQKRTKEKPKQDKGGGVRYDGRSKKFVFDICEDGKKTPFHVAVSEAAGNKDEAQRIAEACFDRHRQGPEEADRVKLEQLREQLLQEVVQKQFNEFPSM